MIGKILDKNGDIAYQGQFDEFESIVPNAKANEMIAEYLVKEIIKD